jgi:hypothetical protein
MHKHLYTFFFLIICCFRCYADDPRYKSEFKSDNGIYTLKVSEIEKEKIKNQTESYVKYTERKWGLYRFHEKNPLYEIPGPISERSAYISDDGKYIVVMNDWPPEQPNDSLVLILIYANGNLLKSYSLSDIYNCGYNISSSVSHFNWSWNDIKVDFISNTLSFKTNELVDFKINISNGKILERRLDRRVNDSSIFVYGKVFGEKDGGFRMEVCHRVYGNIDTTGFVYFSSDYKYHGGWYYTILINEGKEVRIRDGLSDIHDIILNSCAFDAEKLGIRPFGFKNINCR